MKTPVMTKLYPILSQLHNLTATNMRNDPNTGFKPGMGKLQPGGDMQHVNGAHPTSRNYINSK